MKDEYTEITAENASYYEGSIVQGSNFKSFAGSSIFKSFVGSSIGRLHKFNEGAEKPFNLNGFDFKYARIKKEQEVEKVCDLCNTPITEDINDCCMGRELENLEKEVDKMVKIPSNLTKAEAEEALKKASEGEVEVDRWYLLQDVNGGDVCSMYLNKNKKWERYRCKSQFEFDDYTIISPMYTQEELNRSKGAR